MATKRKPQPFSEQLRNAIVNADISRYRIAQKTGLTEAGLSRFVNRVAGLSLDSIDKICACLDLRLIAEETSKRKVK
jgi:DNA-binding Xre family transcriptional regulator